MSNRIVLDRSSYDFLRPYGYKRPEVERGKPKWHMLDTLKVPSTYRGMQLVYVYDDGFHDDINVTQELNIEYYD